MLGHHLLDLDGDFFLELLAPPPLLDLLGGDAVGKLELYVHRLDHLPAEIRHVKLRHVSSALRHCLQIDKFQPPLRPLRRFPPTQRHPHPLLREPLPKHVQNRNKLPVPPHPKHVPRPPRLANRRHLHVIHGRKPLGLEQRPQLRRALLGQLLLPPVELLHRDSRGDHDLPPRGEGVGGVVGGVGGHGGEGRKLPWLGELGL
mmetsp:Transcript_5253/g.13676  ORF Transcript_5253/g.13676 Transcript_5253/m.13676 type:complete len:202 (+) Transcript_5253:419-1024(+)